MLRQAGRPEHPVEDARQLWCLSTGAGGGAGAGPRLDRHWRGEPGGRGVADAAPHDAFAALLSLQRAPRGGGDRGRHLRQGRPQVACPAVLHREWREPTRLDRARRGQAPGGRGGALGVGRRGRAGSARSGQPPGATLRRLRPGSVICFPPAAIVNERFMHIGAGTVIGPHVTLSAGMVPGQQCLQERTVVIGDRCLIGRGAGSSGTSRSRSATTSGPATTSTSPTRTTATRTSPSPSGVKPSRAPSRHRGRLVARPRHDRPARRPHRPARRRRRRLGRRR